MPAQAAREAGYFLSKIATTHARDGIKRAFIAGGYVDGSTASKLLEQNIHIDDVLNNNDSYHALDLVNGLIKTGPTGTNVNDVSVVLIDSPAVLHSAS